MHDLSRYKTFLAIFIFVELRKAFCGFGKTLNLNTNIKTIYLIFFRQTHY